MTIRVGAGRSRRRALRCRVRSRAGVSNATGAGDKVELALSADGSAVAPGTLHFFPFAEGKIEAVRRADRSARRREDNVAAARREAARRRVHPCRGSAYGKQWIRCATRGDDRRSADRARSSPLRLADCRLKSLPAFRRAVASPRCPLFVALAFAFVGGVLLNLMPCVFPVLSLKVLGFAAHRDSRLAMRMHGLAFAAGVVVSFWLLAAGLVALRAAGQQLGWGFQLQSPAVVVALAILFFVARAESLGCVRDAPAAAVGAGQLECEESLRERRLVRRARGRHRVAVLRAVHGGGARLCADRIARWSTWLTFTALGRRHGAAVSAARIVPCMALETAEAGTVDAALEAVARVSALRDGRLAGLGPRCASSTTMLSPVSARCWC